MSSFIVLNQTSFVGGKNIMGNMIIAQEVIHSMRRWKGTTMWMEIKIDLEKAYDQLRWNFIRDLLKEAKLPDNIIGIIMNYVTTSFMQILWNGHFFAKFSPTRGVRQGNLMSSYLFILTMERLSHAISLAVSEHKWKPRYLGKRCPPLSHLFFY